MRGAARGVEAAEDAGVFTERLWRSIKYEEVYLNEYRNPAEVRRRVGEYVQFYNEQRPHQSLAYRTLASVYWSNANPGANEPTATNKQKGADAILKTASLWSQQWGTPHNLGTRLATAIMLYSFGASTAEQEGVRRRELFSAVLTPDLDNRNILAPVLEDLTHELIYLHTSSDGRYRFRTQPNINMMIRRASEDVDPTAISAKVKMVFDAILGKSAALPIGSYVWPNSPTDVPDRQARFVVVYLGPDAAGLSEEQQTTRLLIPIS